MPNLIFKELKRLGMDEDAALELATRSDTNHLATKEDVLVLQESILQVKLDTEHSIREHREETRLAIGELRTEVGELRIEVGGLRSEIKDVRSEMKSELNGLRSEIKDARSEMKSEISGLRSEMKSMHADLKTEIASTNRQFAVTIGGLIVTVLSVFLVNCYFHMLA